MFFDRDIKGGRLPRGTVCFTYDDGPGATVGDGPGPHTLELAHYLFEQQVHATFFVIGRHAERHPDILRRLKEWGHLVGNHTYTHPGLVSVARGGGDVVPELEQTDRIIHPYVSGPVVFFRAPYGNWREQQSPGGPDKPVSLVADLLNRSGQFPHYVGPVNWDITAEDWACWENGVSAAECAHRYLEEAERAGSGILLMHDSAPEDDLRRRNQSLPMTKMLVAGLKERGYRFVRLDAVPEVRTAMQVTYQIALRTHDGRHLHCGDDGELQLALSRNEENREAFGVIDQADGTVALRASNGLLASAGEEEVYFLEDLGAGDVALRTLPGLYLSRTGEGSFLTSGDRGTAQHFLLERLFTD
jgi:peptidoglycan/xylan/chitin deacetylase (PgdA/CDA1 family)